MIRYNVDWIYIFSLLFPSVKKSQLYPIIGKVVAIPQQQLVSVSSFMLSGCYRICKGKAYLMYQSFTLRQAVTIETENLDLFTII